MLIIYEDGSIIFSDCKAAVELGINISYFDSLDYLQTVVFTIGYGHIIPNCHTGKVSHNLKRSVKTAKFYNRDYNYF